MLVAGGFEGVPSQKPGCGWQSPCCLAAVTHVHGQPGFAAPEPPASLHPAAAGVMELLGKRLPGCLLLYLPHRGAGGGQLGTLLRGKSLVM